MNQSQKLARAIEKAQKQLGVKVAIPVETELDKLAQAQAVLNYFKVNDGKWVVKVCDNCGLKFTYRWNIDGIKNCSVPCMAEALRKLGLKWDPNREPERRWGQYVPAIVPPAALDIIQQLQADVLKDPLDNIYPELLE